MKWILLPILFLTVFASSQKKEPLKPTITPVSNIDSLNTAYFAAGCFWCVEAVFESIIGVEEVISGYSGGSEKNPTYSMVSSGKSQHAETVKIIYNPTVISYDTLLMAFFASHDPSTLNRQGPDFGPQYRSIIFYQNTVEKDLAEKYIQKLLLEKTFPEITTQLIPLDIFYKAEIYHQDYEKNNPDNSYIQKVSLPRLKKFQEKFPGLLKSEN